MKNLKRHIVAVLCVLLTLSSYAKEPSRRELFGQALELAENGQYQEAIDLITKIEDASVVDDNILANAQVLKFNIGQKISDNKCQTEALELLKAVIASDPENLSTFKESLLGMIIRYERALLPFEDRMCGIWVSPTQNLQGQYDGSPRYKLFVYKENGTYKAMLNFSDNIVLTTEDMMFDSSSNTLEIYGGDGKFNKGSSRIMTDALVGAVGQTAQDMHNAVALKNKSDLISMENYGGQAAVSLASGLLQSLLTEASVSKTKAFSTVISCNEIAPGIIEVNAEEIDRVIRSDNANNFTVKRGHVRLYKIPFDIETQNKYLPFVQQYKVKYVCTDLASYSWSSLRNVIFSMNDGSYGVSAPIKDAELKKIYLGSEAKGNLLPIIKSINLSSNELLEQFYTDKYLDLLSDIFQRDFYGENHKVASIPLDGDVTEEKLDLADGLIRDYFYYCKDYENTLPYFEEDYSKGNLKSGPEYFQFATCRNQLGYHEDIEIALEGIRKFPEFSLLYSFVLKNLSQKHRFDTPYKELVDAWIRVDSDSPDPHYFCGLWYENAGDRPAAIKEYCKSAERDPNFYFSSIKAGELLFENTREAFGRQEDLDTVIQTALSSASNFEKALRYSTKEQKEYIKEYLCTIYTFLLYNDPSNASIYSPLLQKYSN